MPFVYSKEQEESIVCLSYGIDNAYSPDRILQALASDNWEIHPVKFNGKIIGAIIQKDGDIHTTIAPEYQKRWNPRPYIKNILYPALRKYGEIKSQSAKNDVRGRKWLEKLGFTLTSEDEENYYFKLTEIKFTKE